MILNIYTIQSSNIPYDTIVSFGDSNCDTGNVYNLTNFKWPPVPPYYQGRFSNGPLWIEKLGISKLINYAYGSATTDNTLVTGVTAFNVIVPGVRQQIEMYKNATNISMIDFDRTIYIIWVGGNDYFFNIYLRPSAVVNSLMNGIHDLSQIGAKHFLIVNQSPIQAYPSAISFNMNSYMNALTLAHNHNLSNSIESFQMKYLRISMYLFDVYSLIVNILNNTSAYGITNTRNCWNTLSNINITLCTNPENYIFIDEYHFTTRIHQLIADNVRQLFFTSKGSIKSFHSIFFILLFLISVLYIS
ncbi:unnamed protein product [Adineta steineri]|uniref:Uncharacterized protein n=1 Tax=Adineta steineri TaxID=433720 RepID=A0A818N9V1_9BILA|nr:unnamed protein product [Adineta steineri]